MRSVLVVAFAIGLLACSTYRDQLARGEKAFDANDPNRTLAILRDLEPNFSRLSTGEQANYAYIRGMTDLSVGYKLDARHWLSLANAYEQATPGVLAGERKTKTADALKELNDVVYMKGPGELVNAEPADSAAPAAPPPSRGAEKKDKKKRKKPEAPPAASSTETPSDAPPSQP